jgi:phospholipid/cholesterol/gamma-HCH transport system substrate-binding protein
VGLFVIVGLFIACAALVYLGAQSYFKGAVTYVTYFAESVQGLQVDSVVKYRGVEVGRVRKLGVAPDNTLIEVVMDIGFQGPLGNDMAARLKQVGITGLAYVELDRVDPGDPDLSPALDFTPKYPVIRSRPSDIAQLWNLVEDVVRQIRGVDLKGMAEGAEGALKAAEDLLRGERIKQTLLHVEAAAAHLQSVGAKADRILDRGEVEKLLTATTQAMGEAKNLLTETRAQVKALNLAATGQQAHGGRGEPDRRGGLGGTAHDQRKPAPLGRDLAAPAGAPGAKPQRRPFQLPPAGGTGPAADQGEEMSLPRPATLALGLLLGLALLPGCSTLSPRPALTVEQYTLDYPPPSPVGSPPLNTGLKVARFTTSQEAGGTEMVYEAGPSQRGVYHYHRWRVSPADLVTDVITRDLRASGMFQAVLPWQAGSLMRFKLEGAVEEFLERGGEASPRAVLRVNVTLLDLSVRELPQRLVFQRGYEETEPMATSAPEAQAQGLSRALQRLSARVMAEAREAVMGRLGEGAKASEGGGLTGR